MRTLAFVAALFCPALAAAEPAGNYLGPSLVAVTPDGKQVVVGQADARRLDVVGLDGRRIATVPLPAEPTAIVFAADGASLLVACAAPQSTVCQVDPRAWKIVHRLAAGHSTAGLALLPDGKRLYVSNRFDNHVAVVAWPEGKPLARVATVREPAAAVATPDGRSVFVANRLPADRADGNLVSACLTVIDTATNQAATIRLPNGSTSVQGLCLSADGRYLFATHILARYSMPTTQLERGWVSTNALSVVDARERKLVNTVLLDNVDRGAANPWGLAVSADGKTLCVSHAGTHELSVIDLPGLVDKLLATPATPEAASAKPSEPPAYGSGYATPLVRSDVPNDLAFLVDLRRRVPLPGKGPRGVAVVGGRALVAQYFSDSLAVVDLAPTTQAPAATIALRQTPLELSTVRRGELLFHDATICFQHWQSCASCHPDARVDALNWDLMNDGMGNPKNNRSMLFTHRTPPAMTESVRETAEDAVRAGIRTILFAVRPEAEAAAIDEYLKSLVPLPSPHLVDGKLGPAAERGKALFFSPRVGCAVCHPEPLFTDLKAHDVGSKGPYDRRHQFDTPTLVEAWRTAPYLHDGSVTSVHELIALGKHGKGNGDVEGLSPAEIADLVEFVLSL